MSLDPVIHKGFLDTTGLIEVANRVYFRSVPSWLGNFQFKVYGQAYGKDHGLPPVELLIQARKLRGLVPGQKFNTIFLQKYIVGSKVLPHRDPKNNTGYTVIGVFGEFEGAKTKVDAKEYQLYSGDVMVLPCTIDGTQGPQHEVSAVTKGTRFALILNTIETSENPI